MGFILGLLLGLIGAIGLLGFLAYWLCSRPNHLAVARFINGIAQALATISKVRSTGVPEPDTGEEPVAMESAIPRKGKGRKGWAVNGDDGDKERPE